MQKKLETAERVATSALQLFDETRAEKEMIEKQMKIMQVKMQEMTATIKSLNEQLAAAAVSNAATPSGPLDFDDFFDDPVNWIADAPASTQPSSTSTESPNLTDPFNFGNISNDFNFTYKVPQPFTPTSQQFTPQNSAQQCYLQNRNSLSTPAAPVTPTPVPAKKRKTSSSPFIGEFYQCRQLYDVKIPGENGKPTKSGVTLFCGVINNQSMAGGKNDGEPRQRCVNRVCRKYTDIKNKHWVDGWVVDMFGVGIQAPMITPKMAGL